jgi:hypothetical protein
MKKGTTEAKKAAANARENGNGKATKAVNRFKSAADEKYTVGSTVTVKCRLWDF